MARDELGARSFGPMQALMRYAANCRFKPKTDLLQSVLDVCLVPKPVVNADASKATPVPFSLLLRSVSTLNAGRLCGFVCSLVGKHAKVYRNHQIAVDTITEHFS